MLRRLPEIRHIAIDLSGEAMRGKTMEKNRERVIRFSGRFCYGADPSILIITLHHFVSSDKFLCFPRLFLFRRCPEKTWLCASRTSCMWSERANGAMPCCRTLALSLSLSSSSLDSRSLRLHRNVCLCAHSRCDTIPYISCRRPARNVYRIPF